jgi:diguanylate cyclase (GGDEF)-like protein/PAS domain S-box-containing protein
LPEPSPGLRAPSGDAPGEPIPPSPGAPGDDAPGGRRVVVLISYLMGPAALAVLLVLRQLGMIAREPIVFYLAVFTVIPIVSVIVESAYRRRPDELRLHLRIAVHVAAVTLVIYMSGWGPVLVGAYVFIALENISRSGSPVWKPIALWSLAGIAAGQMAVFYHVAPSVLAQSEAQTLAAMGTFVLMFVVRMAGAAAAEKERAEAAMRTSEDRFRSLVQNSSDTTLVLGSGAIVTYASPSIDSLLGRAPDAVVGRVAGELVHREDRAAVEAEMTRRLARNAVTEPLQFRMMRAEGTWRHVEATVTDLRDRPSVGGYVANIRDITERKEAEALLEFQALHDPLTGLPNRLLLVDRLRGAIARDDGPPPVVMFLDLDRFKLVNDSLGHGAGDLLLMDVAARLRGVSGEHDTVARFGGDEFVILCEALEDREALTSLAQRIMASFEEPFEVDGETFHIGVSIGVATVDEELASAEELLSDADFAMYLAKARSGTGRVQLFDQAARASARQRIHTETALARALERGELEVFYQPIAEVSTGRWTGTEALVRWHHPTRGLLEPAAFIEVAEQTGMIVPIGAWVLADACAQVRAWNAGLGEHERLSLSVNLSARQLAEPDIVRMVAGALVEAGVDLSTFELYLEMTESHVAEDEDEAFARLGALHDLGMRLAIDDFGTGYSSLRYVRELPVSVVKIDQSFVSGLGRSARDEAIVRSITQLAHTLDLHVVAEGVTSSQQASRLSQLSCDFAQGFLYGAPESAEAFRHLVTAKAG